MITQKELKEHVTYNKYTGEFFNKKTGRLATYKNNTKSGIRLRIHINGTNYYASRLAILYVTGRYPDGFVRVKNGDTTDLRFKNLVFNEEREQVNTECFDYDNKCNNTVHEESPLKRFFRWING